MAGAHDSGGGIFLMTGLANNRPGANQKTHIVP